MSRLALQAFGLEEDMMKVTPYGNGLINHTWKVELPGRKFILQKINTEVFPKPALISCNIRKVSEFLKQEHPGYAFVAPLTTPAGQDTYEDQSGCYRLFPFVSNSTTVDVVQDAGQAGKAAAQFGKFTSLLTGFDCTTLNITIPSFHNLSDRFSQFELSLINGNRRRVLECEEMVKRIMQLSSIVTEYEKITRSSAFRKRVTHHDTKISNVLFDTSGEAICVIDLDTIMPGYFISDVGDMMRTYLSPVSEEERDESKICIREDFYEAIVGAYYREMKNELTDEEKDHFFYAGKFIIYMQTLRFLTDYFNNDRYYKAAYAGQNLNRASNQLVLLEKYMEKENLLREISDKIVE